MSVAAVGRALIAVVCDGVSTAPGSGPAAEAAADAACAVLAEAVAAERGDLRGAMLDAVAIAHAAVLAAHAPDPRKPPSCTLAAAAVVNHAATFAWIGDTRIYWLAARGAECLTSDDSWAAEQIAAGRLDRATAEADPRAHQIQRWLGADSPVVLPHVGTFRLPSAGRLVTCTDGLWNHASAASDLAAQLDTFAPDAWPIDVARHLTLFALEAGGQDNITVAVAAVTRDPRDTDEADQDRPSTRTTRLTRARGPSDAGDAAPA